MLWGGRLCSGSLMVLWPCVGLSLLELAPLCLPFKVGANASGSSVLLGM